MTPLGTSSEGWPSSDVGGGNKGGGYTPTSGHGASRANRDDNWRNPQEDKPNSSSSVTPSWGNHWQPPSSPGNVHVGVTVRIITVCHRPFTGSKSLDLLWSDIILLA